MPIHIEELICFWSVYTYVLSIDHAVYESAQKILDSESALE